MPVETSRGAGDGVAFMVGAGLVAELVAKACSSPQTAELNADKRAPTLMKWVNIGLVEAVLFIAIAAYVDPPRRKAILTGGALEAGITYMQYRYAKMSGLQSDEPPTEDW